MNHGGITLNDDEYFLPCIIMYGNPYMSTLWAINSLWMDYSLAIQVLFYTSPWIYHPYISPHIYISNLIHILYVHKIKIKYFFLQNSPNMCPKHRIIREKLNTKWANKLHMSKRLLYCFAGKPLVMKLTYISSIILTQWTLSVA